ncbi:MAG: hypothetical protein RID42_12380 [Alphaproteobacteria bacterium]
MSSKLHDALHSPTSVFNEPGEVLEATFLTEVQKRDVLARWEADARELQVAAEEGMDGGEPDMLRQVRSALRRIGDAPAEHAPTKQG